MYNHGRIDVYRERLGSETLQVIADQARKVVKFSNDDLQFMIDRLRNYLTSKVKNEKELSIFGHANT